MVKSFHLLFYITKIPLYDKIIKLSYQTFVIELNLMSDIPGLVPNQTFVDDYCSVNILQPNVVRNSSLFLTDLQVYLSLYFEIFLFPYRRSCLSLLFTFYFIFLCIFVLLLIFTDIGSSILSSKIYSAHRILHDF